MPILPQIFITWTNICRIQNVFQPRSKDIRGGLSRVDYGRNVRVMFAMNARSHVIRPPYIFQIPPKFHYLKGATATKWKMSK
jgi:hypothetical protein